MTLPQALMRHILYNIYEVYDTHTYVRSIILENKYSVSYYNKALMTLPQALMRHILI